MFFSIFYMGDVVDDCYQISWVLVVDVLKKKYRSSDGNFDGSLVVLQVKFFFLSIGVKYLGNDFYLLKIEVFGVNMFIQIGGLGGFWIFQVN